MLNKHRFIVFEGIDGSGTTTQAKLLAAEIGRGKDWATCFTHQPSDYQIGLMLRTFLGSGRKYIPSWKVMALLFAADRQDHYEREILPNLKNRDVVCDRYILSTLAYQGATSAIKYSGEDWYSQIKKIIPTLDRYNEFVEWPDITIYLDVPVEEAWGRVNSRGAPREVYEELEFQKQVVEAYRVLYTDFAYLFPNIVVIDGMGSAEEVAKRCLEAVKELGGES